MLPPVSAVSSVTAAAPKQPAASAATILLANAAGPVVVSSNAANSSVEGKLSIMLAALRNRMVQSLLDIMNAASDTLDIPREADEEDVSYALRVAGAVQDLPPKQLAAIEQQLQGTNQALPLQLVAQALKNPTGPAAAQVIAFIETAGYDGRDLVTEAVIDSYSENEGAGQPALVVSPLAADAAEPSVAAKEQELPQAVPQPAPLQQPSQASSVASAGDTRPSPASMATTKEVPIAPAFAADIVEEIAAPAAADSPIVSQTALVTLVEALEVVADPAHAETPNLQAISAAVPIALKEIAADVQEGLQIAIQFAIEAAGPEIVNMIGEGDHTADVVIANALVADVLDAAELQQQDAATVLDERSLPLGAVHAEPQPAASDDGAMPTAAGPNRPAAESSTPAPSSVAPITVVPIPLPMQPAPGVGYVVAPYPPADSPAEESSDASIDRVDAIGDEPEGGRHGGQWNQDDQAEEEEQSLDRSYETAAGISETEVNEMPIAANAVDREKPGDMPAALPAPGAAALQMEAYDFYRRMAVE